LSALTISNLGETINKQKRISKLGKHLYTTEHLNRKQDMGSASAATKYIFAINLFFGISW
jgi:hypothetical protein